MRSKILIGAFAAAVAFLLATNPLVSQAAGLINSNDVANNSLKSKDVKDNTLKGKDVKDGMLTGADVGDGTLTGGDLLIRAATASDDSSALSGTSAVSQVLATTITAPARGYLMMVAGSDVYGDFVGSDCWLAVDGAEFNPSERVLGNNSNVDEVDCATNGAVVVNAGAHTVQLMADPGSSSVIFDESTLDVIFVPFNSTGGVPARATPLGGKSTSGN
jgi:hypothetical protein